MLRVVVTLVVLFGFVAGLSAHPGIGIVMDSRGNVFYTDLRQVWRISPEGAKTIAVPDVHTHELCLDEKDNLYGEHLRYEGDTTGKWRHRVWRRAPDGTVVDVIPEREGFLQNYSFVRDRNGNMYWADRAKETTVIRKRSADGKFSVFATGDFRDVRWMTSRSDGTVFLIDDGDLRRITPDGNVSTVARNLDQRSLTQIFVKDRHALMGLWPDKQGNVYVAVYSARIVKRVAPDGRVSVVARSSWPWSPTGGMVAPNGDGWILENSATNAVRVRRIHRGSERTWQ
ncbi:MAG: hypothetical protein ACR2L2_16990 [Acidobacteriota bacterium]